MVRNIGSISDKVSHGITSEKTPVQEELNKVLQGKSKTTEHLRQSVPLESKTADINDQQDAHDLLLRMTAKLDEEQKKKDGASLPGETAVSSCMRTVTGRTKTCECGHTDPMDSNINLGLQVAIDSVRSFQSAINEHFKSEQMEVRCEKCGCEKPSTIEHQMQESPSTLIVAMNRFEFNGTQEKLTRKIEVPYMLTHSSVPKLLSNASEVYKLVSYINHEGEIKESGHYTAVVFEGNQAILYDDEKISILNRKKQVELKNSSYILCYKRQTTDKVAVDDASKKASSSKKYKRKNKSGKRGNMKGSNGRTEYKKHQE